MKTSILKETQDYFVTYTTDRDGAENCYQIINKNYNIVEIETSILPQAFKYVDDLQQGLDTITNPSTNDDLLAPTTSDVVAFGKNKLN